MHFLALFVIIVCLLLITYKNPRWGFASLGIVLCVATLFYWLTPTDSTQKKANPLTQYALLTDATVKVGYAESFELTARLTNENLEKPLSAVYIQTELRECDQNAPDECTVLGEETNLVKQFIPASQSIDVSITLGTQLPRAVEGQLQWHHQVINAE